MALRVDLKIRKNDNDKDFISKLEEFCRQYSVYNDCAIEFDDTKYPDIKFYWWDQNCHYKRGVMIDE